MAAEGKLTLSEQKQDIPGTIPAINYTPVRFYFKAVGGETFIDLTNLGTLPPEISARGILSNPSAATLASAQLLMYPNSLELKSTSGGSYLDTEFQIVTSTKINLVYYDYSTSSYKARAALPGEIFQGTIWNVPRTGLICGDTRRITASGTLLANTTDINIGQEFAVGYNSAVSRIGEVATFLEGMNGPLTRNANNSAVDDGVGNGYEVPVAGGLGTVFRLNASAVTDYDRQWVSYGTNAVIIRPEGSRDAAIEVLAGQVDQLKTFVEGNFDVSIGASPTTVNLKQFGDVVIALQNAVALLRPNVGENLSALRQYALTVTGSTWTSRQAVGIPYRTLDGTWRLKFNIEGGVTSSPRSSYSLSISGVMFKSGVDQAIHFRHTSDAEQYTEVAQSGASTIYVGHGAVSTSCYQAFGDVELASKPTFVP